MVKIKTDRVSYSREEKSVRFPRERGVDVYRPTLDKDCLILQVTDKAETSDYYWHTVRASLTRAEALELIGYLAAALGDMEKTSA